MDIAKIISLPVYYDPEGQYIFDADGKLVATVLGRGGMKAGIKGDQQQDFMGKYIATCINMYEALKSRGEEVNINL